MTPDQSSSEDAIFDDEAYAQEMREYWSWMASQPDPAEYITALAEERDLEQMEAEGIAAAERNACAEMLQSAG